MEEESTGHGDPGLFRKRETFEYEHAGRDVTYYFQDSPGSTLAVTGGRRRMEKYSYDVFGMLITICTKNRKEYFGKFQGFSLKLSQVRVLAYLM